MSGDDSVCTFSLQDDHVPKLALTPLVVALHLDVVGGLWLKVSDGMPVAVTYTHKYKH